MANLVSVYGKGVYGGLSGGCVEFYINTCNAGDGALGLSVDGPSHVQLHCDEQKDGTYKVYFHPETCGHYEISVTFDSKHVSFSPYTTQIVEHVDKLVEICGDARRCYSRGAGLTYAQLGEEAEFTVDASEAGRGSLMVGVESSNEPARRTKIKHMDGNKFRVSYVLEDIGQYKLKVLWADEHIPGSPFELDVLP